MTQLLSASIHNGKNDVADTLDDLQNVPDPMIHGCRRGFHRPHSANFSADVTTTKSISAETIKAANAIIPLYESIAGSQVFIAAIFITG